MPLSLSLSTYTRTSSEPRSRRRQLPLEPRHVCQPRVVHHMVYDSLDGRTFRVRRLRCDGCGRRWRDVHEQQSDAALPTLRRGRVDAVEASF